MASWVERRGERREDREWDKEGMGTMVESSRVRRIVKEPSGAKAIDEGKKQNQLSSSTKAPPYSIVVERVRERKTRTVSLTFLGAFSLAIRAFSLAAKKASSPFFWRTSPSPSQSPTTRLARAETPSMAAAALAAAHSA
jgi:hypothetical protein